MQICKPDLHHRYLPASIMNRYLLLAAAAAAASVAVTGPLPDPQWQNNNRLVDFVPESPTAFNQDGLHFPAQDTPWMIAEGRHVMPVSNEKNSQDVYFGDPQFRNDNDDIAPVNKDPLPRSCSTLRY